MISTIGWAGALVVLLGLATGYVLAIVPGMLMLCLVMLVRLSTSQTVRSGVSCTFSLSQDWAKPGDVISAHLSLKNDQPFPIFWLAYALAWPEGVLARATGLTSHYLANRRSLSGMLSLKWFERVTRHIEIVARDRGEFAFGPADIRLSDPMGLVSVSALVETEASLLVYPRVLPIDLDGALFLSPFGDFSAPSYVYDDPLCFRGIREYTPDDPLSRIEWKATARTGSLQVRVSDASFASEVMIVVDVSTTDKPWEGVRRDWLERTIVVAASLASHTAERGYRLSLHTNGVVRGTGAAHGVPVGSGPAHYLQCMSLLGRLLDVRWGRIEQVLAQLLPRASGRAHIYLLSPAISDETIREADRIRAAGVSITLVNTCPEGEPPVFSGPVYTVLQKEPFDELERITLLRKSS